MASTVTLGGNPVQVGGEFPRPGQAAPAFKLVDESDRVVYSELVPEIKSEPDYDAALKALA